MKPLVVDVAINLNPLTEGPSTLAVQLKVAALPAVIVGIALLVTAKATDCNIETEEAFT
jgi:hypothetical protein